MTYRHGAIAATLVMGLALVGVAVGASAVAQHHSRYVGPMMGVYASPMMGAYATAPATSATQWHRFRGRVTSANRRHHSFWMRTTSRGSVQIYTNRNTYWDDCGWGYTRMGSRVDVRAYRSHGHWMAAHMRQWHGDWMP